MRNHRLFEIEKGFEGFGRSLLLCHRRIEQCVFLGLREVEKMDRSYLTQVVDIHSFYLLR